VIGLYALETTAIILVSIFELGSLAFIFISKTLLHSVLSLTLAFIGNSALFLILQQPLLAIIQLFIFVGGISTYALVGVASASFSRFRHTNRLAFIAIFLVFLAVISYPVFGMGLSNTAHNAFTPQQIASGINGYMGLFYLITVMLFGAALGSIALYKEAGKKK